MKIKTKLLIIAGVYSLGSSFAAAAEDGKQSDSATALVAHLKNSDLYFVRGSFAEGDNQYGHYITMIDEVVSTVGITKDQVSFHKNMIYADSCATKTGAIKSFGLDGVYLGESAFVIGADSVGSFEARVMCNVYEKNHKKQ